MTYKPFEILYSWEEMEDKDPLLQWTSASIRINLYDHNITYNVNNESKSTNEDVKLAMYPLALWFARSWWRLLYETASIQGTKQKNPYWRLAHEIQSAGNGYIWPDITFVSDGKSMQILSNKTQYSNEISTINFLYDFFSVVPLQNFIDEVTNCIENVLDRIESVKIKDDIKELYTHWQSILEELNDSAASHYRKIEAMLGYNPDEADVDIIEKFIKESSAFGTGLDEEIASIINNENKDAFKKMKELAQNDHVAIRGKFNLQKFPINSISTNEYRPWEIGGQLAVSVREFCGNSNDIIDDKILCDLIGVTSNALFEDIKISSTTLGIVNREDNSSKLFFRGNSKLARRFNVSRIIADMIIANKNNIWLPVSNSGTWRQKVQRAFAGEFLCPVDNLLEFLDGQYDEDSIAAAAEHFSVNESVPRTHLFNKKILTDALLVV
jgi:hypothetical protein